MADAERAPRRGTITTLTLETGEARYLTVRQGRVAGWGSMALPAEAVEAGAVRDAPAVAEALDCLFRKRRLERGRLVVGVGGAAAAPLGLTLPLQPAAALGEAVREAAARLLPVPLEEQYLSWQVVDGQPAAERRREAAGRPTLRVYALAVPRALIDGYLEALRLARLRPAVMDLKALAVVRVARPAQGIVAHLGRDYVDIALVVQQMPVALDTVALAVGYPGGAAPEGDGASTEWRARLDALLAAAERLAAEYCRAHPQAPLSPDAPLVASGQALASPEALEHLAARSGRPVARPTSPLPFPGELPLERYIVHLGLALKRDA